MSASAPLVPPETAPAPARPVRNPLGLVGLVVAIVAAVVEIVATPIDLVMQFRGGAPFAAAVVATAVPVVVLSIVALILGIVAANRPGLSRASAGAAIGIAAFLLVGQLVGVIATLVAAAL